MSDRTRTYSWEDPLLGAQAALTMSGLAYMQKLAAGELPSPPIGITMNFRGMEVSKGQATFYAEPAEFHYNPIGVVHGGFHSTLLDSALGCAVHTTLEQGFGYTTLELHVNMVRALTKEVGTVRAVASVIHVGRQMATAEAKLLDAHDKLYAHATTTCLIFEIPKG